VRIDDCGLRFRREKGDVVAILRFFCRLDVYRLAREKRGKREGNEGRSNRTWNQRRAEALSLLLLSPAEGERGEGGKTHSVRLIFHPIKGRELHIFTSSKKRERTISSSTQKKLNKREGRGAILHPLYSSYNEREVGALRICLLLYKNTASRVLNVCGKGGRGGGDHLFRGRREACCAGLI